MRDNYNIAGPALREHAAVAGVQERRKRFMVQPTPSHVDGEERIGQVATTQDQQSQSTYQKISSCVVAAVVFR